MCYIIDKETGLYKKIQGGTIMSVFEMPKYRHPDFSEEMFVNAPNAKYDKRKKMEYFQITITVHLCTQNILK